MTNESIYPWIQTYTGAQHFLMQPEDQEYHILDIAHSLSNLCRFGGHCGDFYSVAQHSVIVAEILPDKHKLCGLLHDAPEAFTGDIMSPLKLLMEDQGAWKVIERHTEIAIATKYDLPWPIPEIVKQADERALATEARDIMDNVTRWGLVATPLSEKIKPMSPEAAENVFLELYADLRVTP